MDCQQKAFPAHSLRASCDVSVRVDYALLCAPRAVRDPFDRHQSTRDPDARARPEHQPRENTAARLDYPATGQYFLKKECRYDGRVSETRAQTSIGPNDVLRFVLELFAFFTLCFWGFVAWPLPWNIVVGIGAPAIAIVLWALFRSPRAVFRIDPFGRALVEIIVMASAALAWWDLGQPIVAIVFAVVATASGILSGRKELA